MPRLEALGIPALLALAGVATAAGAVTVESRIAYANPAALPAHRADCALETHLPRLIQDQARGALAIDDGAAGRVFRGQIIEIADPGQSAWSGRKALTIVGTLSENGVDLGVLTARERTGRGPADGCGAPSFAVRGGLSARASPAAR